ncbi:transposase, partial [Sporosarcina contaminans]
DIIEQDYFELPKHIVADAGYGSEQNYDDILSNRKREALITYGMYIKEQEKKYKQNKFNAANWQYDEENDVYTCPNEKRLLFKYHSVRTDKTGFTRNFKVYECEDCSGCPFRSLCTKAKEGNHRKLMVNEKWEQQKEYVRTKLSDEKTGSIYRQRKIDVEPVFGFLKANLRFTRFSVRGKSKVENEMGLALMAVNLRKFTANRKGGL